MKLEIKIDQKSKDRMIAAWFMYELGNRIMHVLYSYKKDGFNVYAFSSHFHIGIKKIDGVVHEKVMELDKEDKLTIEFINEIAETIELNNRNLSEYEKENVLDAIVTSVNSGIKEYITRDRVYNAYKDVKTKVLSNIEENIREKLKRKQDILDDILKRRIRIKYRVDEVDRVTGESLDEPSYEFLNLKIKVLIDPDPSDGTTRMFWTVEKDIDNLNTLLDQSLNFFYPNYRNTEYSSRDLGADGHEILGALYRYILVTSYYTLGDLFEKIMKTTTSVHRSDDVGSEVWSILDSASGNNSFVHNNNNNYFLNIIRNPVRNHMRIRQQILRNERSLFLDYSTIDNLAHLLVIENVYNILTDKHRKYVKQQIKDIESNIFNLNIDLGGAKRTRQTLYSLLQLDQLKDRIAELRNTPENVLPF